LIIDSISRASIGIPVYLPSAARIAAGGGHGWSGT
jgi:hypothetical protein